MDTTPLDQQMLMLLTQQDQPKHSDLDFWLQAEFPALDMTLQGWPSEPKQQQQLLHPAPLSPLTLGAAAVDEKTDKRRRNTEASARFRLKKKQREQEIKGTAQVLQEQVQELQRRIQQQDVEIAWLRQLVTDKQSS